MTKFTEFVVSKFNGRSCKLVSRYFHGKFSLDQRVTSFVEAVNSSLKGGTVGPKKHDNINRAGRATTDHFSQGN